MDAGYFPDLVVGSSFVFATTQQRLPYITADPSACFSSNAITSCNYDGVLNTGLPGLGVGSTNGLGPDTMLQTDASLSFLNATEIPEPATMTFIVNPQPPGASRRASAPATPVRDRRRRPAP